MNEKQWSEIVCTYCHSHLEVSVEVLHCSQCRRDFALVEAIPDFRDRDEYWCNGNRDKMPELNVRAQETNDCGFLRQHGTYRGDCRSKERVVLALEAIAGRKEDTVLFAGRD